jgi:regulator of replication initiation timing
MQNKEKGSIIKLLADCKEKITKLEKENAELKAENSKLQLELIEIIFAEFSEKDKK